MNLTNREAQYLKRSVSGWGLRRIAKDLGVSVTRARHLRDQVVRKLSTIS